MLLAMDVPLYKRLNVHGYWLVRDTKMSKSLGNVVEPEAMAARAGLSGMRYFLLREMVFGSDSSFSDEAFVGRFNADLANDLGNLANRTLAMTAKYFGSVVPAAGPAEAADTELARLACEAMQNFVTLFGAAQFSRALEARWEFVRGLNKHLDAMAPWTLYKEGKLARLGGSWPMCSAVCADRRVSVAGHARGGCDAPHATGPGNRGLEPHGRGRGVAPLATGTTVAATSNSSRAWRSRRPRTRPLLPRPRAKKKPPSPLPRPSPNQRRKWRSRISPSSICAWAPWCRWRRCRARTGSMPSAWISASPSLGRWWPDWPSITSPRS